MKKILFAGLLLFAFAGEARADLPVSITAEKEATTIVVDVSSGTASFVLSDAAVMPEREALEIQNIDPTAKVYCMAGGASPTVGGGRLIPPNGGVWALNIAARNDSERIVVKCITDAGAGATKLAVTQAH